MRWCRSTSVAEGPCLLRIRTSGCQERTTTVGLFILDADGNEIAVDPITWSLWFAEADARRIARTDISSDCYISTVFLGMDHGRGGQRLLYETMVFGGTFG